MRLAAGSMFAVAVAMELTSSPARAQAPVVVWTAGPTAPTGRAELWAGRVARALGLTRAHDGLDLVSSVLVVRPRRGNAPPVACGPRIGLSVARDVPWRFWWEGHPAVSGPRRIAGTGDDRG